MLEINKRYLRTAPKGDENIIIIKSEQELDYHNDLVKDGFKYKEIVPSVIPGGTCVSCEG